MEGLEQVPSRRGAVAGGPSVQKVGYVTTGGRSKLAEISIEFPLFLAAICYLAQ